MNTNNNHFIGVRGNQVFVLKPISAEMSPEEAMIAAAWLVTMAQCAGCTVDFNEVLKEVQSS